MNPSWHACPQSAIQSINHQTDHTNTQHKTKGTACAEVEVDCLTGDARVLRADVVMDVGASINPSIDIGQIEGAYVQVRVLFSFVSVKGGGVGSGCGPANGLARFLFIICESPPTNHVHHTTIP